MGLGVVMGANFVGDGEGEVVVAEWEVNLRIETDHE
jgi:hypothetical protein